MNNKLLNLKQQLEEALEILNSLLGVQDSQEQTTLSDFNEKIGPREIAYLKSWKPDAQKKVLDFNKIASLENLTKIQYNKMMDRIKSKKANQ